MGWFSEVRGFASFARFGLCWVGWLSCWFVEVVGLVVGNLSSEMVSVRSFGSSLALICSLVGICFGGSRTVSSDWIFDALLSGEDGLYCQVCAELVHRYK